MSAVLALVADIPWRARLAGLVALMFNGLCVLLLPVMPVVLTLLLRDLRFVRKYRVYLRKFVVHFQALREGPVQHYLADVFLRVKQVPAHIEGECIQCGNCCLDKRCAFLEPMGEDKWGCGIYGTYLRRYSNCGSFPLHAHDIARYQCPSYFVVSAPKTIWLNKAP
jgi:hypothetical protein